MPPTGASRVEVHEPPQSATCAHGTLDDPQVLLPEVWGVRGRHHALRTAVMCGSDRRSWGELNGAMNRIANALRAEDFGPGRRAAVLMDNGIETVETMFGIVKAGMSVVPLSTMLTGDQLATLIDDSQAEAVFVGAEQRALIEAQRDRLPRVREWFSCGFTGVGWRSTEALRADASVDEPATRLGQDDEFNIIYSSGTTGLPKGIVQTHRARLHWSFSNAIEMGITAASRVLTTTPLFSNGTWLVALPALFVGAALHVMPQFDAGEFLKLVERHRITHTFMVPTQFIALLESPQLADADLSSLTCALTAGSPLRTETKRAILARVTPGLYQLYGFSEGFATMLKPHEHAAKFDSVGTPVLGFDLRILDDAGRVLPPGEVGEVAGYGAGLMRAYHGRPHETQALIWRDERGRSFVRSGDLGRLDEDGYLSIVGRGKDMIISGGFNVFPADIEAILREHEAVLDVAVIGIPHPLWGEQCLALVIPRGDAALSPEVLRDWANARLGKPQRLAAVELRTEFPRNALGKIMKQALREPYWGQDA